MNDADFASLVDALTPRVVEACQNRMSGTATNTSQSQFINRPLTSSQLATTPSRAQTATPPGRQGVYQPSTASAPFTSGSSTSRPSTSGSSNSRPSTSGSSNRWTDMRSTPRDELRRTFSKRRTFKPYQKKDQTKSIDVILLPDHTWKTIVKGKAKAALHRDGFIVDMFKFDKSWSEKQVFDALCDAFRAHLTAESGEPITFCIKKSEGVDLVQPRIRPNESLDGAKICEIFAKKTIYLCPDRKIRRLSEQTVISSDESEEEDES